jgi:transposase-like protein
MSTLRQQSKVAEKKSEIVRQIPLACSDEAAAVEFMEAQRWGDEAACPRCGDTDVYKMMDRKTGERNARYLWRCRGCTKQFTVRVGTVMEDSPIPLRHWCFAFWAACSSKKGVSAMQIQRQTGLSYKSALFLMHRIRLAMMDTEFEPLTGTVEVDETYVGGKPRKGDGKKHKPGRGTSKTPVVAAVERGGKVRARRMVRVNARTLHRFVQNKVDTSATIYTDEYPGYRGVGKRYAGGHHAVKHSAGEYARGMVHTNTVEGFFSLLKRGIYGTFHSVSDRHLHKYLWEFEFRYNNRNIDDGARTALAIRGAEGKRYTKHRSIANMNMFG